MSKLSPIIFSLRAQRRLASSYKFKFVLYVSHLILLEKQLTHWVRGVRGDFVVLPLSIVVDEATGLT